MPLMDMIIPPLTPSMPDTPVDRRLALMQLSDSFFPSGSFTLSHGLEALISDGQIRSAEDVQTFLSILLQNKIGTMDAVALVHAYRASVQHHLPEIHRADHTLFAQTLIQGSRDAQRKSGRALLTVACSTWEDAQLQALQADVATGAIYGLHPIIFAVVGRAAGLSEGDAIAAFLHSFVTGVVSAALRLGEIGRAHV